MFQIRGAEAFGREPYYLYGECSKAESNEVYGMFLERNLEVVGDGVNRHKYRRKQSPHSQT